MKPVLVAFLGALLISCGGGGDGGKNDGSAGAGGATAGAGGGADASAGTGAAGADAGTTSTAGADGGAAGTTDASADIAEVAAAADASGAGGMKMPCDLQITDATGSNVGFTEFANTGAQGSTRTSQTPPHVQSQGIHAQQRVGTATHVLDFTVAGPTPVVGGSYAMGTIDATLADGQGALYFSTIDGTDNYTWEPVAGGTLTVTAIAAGVIPQYYNATFKFDGLQLTPRTAATGNKATGTFNLSGLCLGAITK